MKVKTEAMAFEPWGSVPGNYKVTSERSGNTYRVHIGEPADMCTCPGFAHNWRRPSFKGCRHIKGVRALGLVERVYDYRKVAS